MSRSRIPYPWMSSVAALFIICWQLVRVEPEMVLPYQLPEIFLQNEILIAAVAIWLLLVAFDVSRFVKAWVGYKAQLIQHEEQIAELFDSKRELGTRVRTYSDHADKLKLFISDRLLEYIEYDEKFLHFKNIASEVRHNGVISYDKAQTALKKAADLCADRLDENSESKEFEQASESLLYLWDLLDIATTDNITLHVANRIYDSEEYYFQSMLNKSEASSLPFEPTFSMFAALQKALLPIVDNPAGLRLIDNPVYPLNYDDERFHLVVTADSDMLGNRNHMVLLLENLLNNAVYYADQKVTKNRYSRVAILLSIKQGQIEIDIYNRGPKIKDEDRSHIFQLGYSSRRIRDHHGKGLGLYFVNEISKGFEGSVNFENIETRKNTLSLRIELKNGDVETHLIAVTEDNGKPLCQIAKTDNAAGRSLDWSFASLINRVEVSSDSNAEPQIITGLDEQQNITQLDKSEALMSHWVLEIINRKKSAKLVFKVLDVRGVCFKVKFPTALSRLENQDAE